MRIEKFYKLWLAIQPFRYVVREELNQWQLIVCHYEGLRNYQHQKELGLVDPGCRWGKTGDTGIFTKEIQVTDAYSGYPLYLEIITGGEAMVSIDGKPFQGNDPNHSRVLLTSQSNGHELYRVEVESFVRLSHNEIGETNFDAACTGEFTQAHLCAVHPLAQEFLWDIQFVLEFWQSHPEFSTQLAGILAGVFGAFDPVNQESFLAYASEGRAYIDQQLKLLAGQQDDFTLWMIGQSHLDLAWFWRKDETYRKVMRTFTSVLRNMEQFDDYRFMMPQVNLFKMLKEVSPETFEEVKQRVQEGRIEIAGLLYVEPDTNLVNGEWLVRQILWGRKFYQEEFGFSPTVESLIDAFGYSGNLPQILHKSGIDGVMVTKMRWYNDTNKFPYTAFRWKGIDGTEVLSATMPGFNYPCNHQAAKYAMEQNLQPALVKDIPVFYGWGDGGGGADDNILQGLQRLMKWYQPARVKTSGFQEFFDHLRKMQDALPIWWDEIYQEGHRGCYTSQARSKQLNRQSESLYRSLEFVSGIASLQGQGKEFSALQENMELILINQFHDILPGSAVHQVYLDSYRDYEKVLTEGNQFLAESIAELHQSIDTSGEGTPIVVWNFNQSALPALVTLPWNEAKDGRLVNSQGQTVEHTFDGNALVFMAANLPSLGYEVFRFMEGRPADGSLSMALQPGILENAMYRVELNDAGQITRLVDKHHQRDLLVQGTVGNCMKLYFDYPKSNDAWDIDADYQNSFQILEGRCVQAVQSDALRQWVTYQYQFGDSTIEQDIVLWNDTQRADFDTRVDWHEKHRLLKAEFMVDITTPKAVYDIPFGVIERDTRPNNSYQQAQFEVPGLSFVDLSEGNYGVALVSEHKHGFSAKDQLLTISLLRAPTFPDPEADQGQHAIHYSLIGHGGDFRSGKIIHQSRSLVNPVVAVPAQAHAGKLPSRCSFFCIDKENAIMEALKPAEDGDGWILRVFESYGQHDHCTLQMNVEFVDVVECNLVEEAIAEPIMLSGGSFQFDIRPFEIKTFRLRQ